MNNWFERWIQRQSHLAQGADGDLVRDNRNRYRLAFGLIGFGFLLGLLDTKIQIPRALHLIAVGISVVSLITGALLAAWARQEAAFLSRPDPEEPPRIFK
jgi:hypothetical protein